MLNLKALVNVQAYLPDDKEIITILKICKFVNDKNDWKLWNNVNYRLLFTDVRSIKITKKKCSEIRLFDLLVLADPVDVIRQSSIGLYDDTSKEFLLLGKDDILRQCNYTSNGWISAELNVEPIIRLRNLLRNSSFDFQAIDKNFYCGKLCNQVNSLYPECLKKLLETILTP